MLHLEPVTAQNWRDGVFLTTDPDRRNPLDEEWVTSTAFSMLQAVYEENWDCRIIYDGETAVGFVFYGLWKEDRPLLCRYTIDADWQGKGYGQKKCMAAGRCTSRWKRKTPGRSICTRSSAFAAPGRPMRAKACMCTR